jgi:beta-lactamase superfamily II metal-dependent hydrolase
MYEIDFLPVGDAGRSGDAICMRFTRPDTGTQAVVVIDAGFKDDGIAIAEHIPKLYGTSTVDLAVLTHPDGDHIGGMGEVVRGLNVKQLWLHDIGAHGGKDLSAADAVDDLKKVATGHGTAVYEAWPGNSAFGGGITVLGPSKDYYDELVKEQLAETPTVEKASKTLLEAVRGLADRFVTALGIEIPFEAKDVNPRNNSSMVVLGRFDDDMQLFSADAGVPALDRAWDYAQEHGLAQRPTMVHIPHHGSRRNCSSAWLDRLLGSAGESSTPCSAIVSCVANSDKHPAGKVVNAYKRRECRVVATAGNTVCHYGGTPAREGWGSALELPPMAEEDD